VRAKLGADTIVDSTKAMLIWEPRRVCPSYAVPEEDIEAELAPAQATNGPVARGHPGGSAAQRGEQLLPLHGRGLGA
jgi:hypothetical protein